MPRKTHGWAAYRSRASLNASLACVLPVSAFGYGQTSKPQTPKPDATVKQVQACVIVKRHVHKFGENMSRVHPHRPFDYVEGSYPSGFKWRFELSDSDVRELQKKGGKKERSKWSW